MDTSNTQFNKGRSGWQAKDTMDRGLIHNIDNIPPNTRVEVWDFDIEGLDEVDLQTNDEGQQFYLSVYES